MRFRLPEKFLRGCFWIAHGEHQDTENVHLTLRVLAVLVRNNKKTCEKQNNIVKQLQNAKNKNNALCINILRFKFNPVCHYEPSRKAWRGNPVKKS